MSDGLSDRLAALHRRLREFDALVVAFSGGTDSAFLLAAAVRAVGARRVVAATSVSASLASGECRRAADFAAELSVEIVPVATQELSRPGYTANGRDRCYHCKAELLGCLADLARQRGIGVIATGTNADDLRDPHRPGLRAGVERGVVTPLADAGLSKQDIRAASRTWGLPTWDKPQSPCLASRIAYGVAVDAPRLARVDRAERSVRAALRAEGIPAVNLRVRDLGDRARVELDRAAVARASSAPAVLTAVRSAGFPAAEVDSRGFRSGALNEPDS